MRNLILFAVAFSVALSEADVEQLGYEPTEEDFRNYFGIPEDAVKGEFKSSQNFDAFGDLNFYLNAEEKAALDPDTISADGFSTNEKTSEGNGEANEGIESDLNSANDLDVTGEEVVNSEPKEIVIPENLKAKHKELLEEIESQKKEVSTAEKNLEKVKSASVKKIEKAEEALEKENVKLSKDKENPVRLAATNKAKSDVNVAKKEAAKEEKAATTLVNKASEKVNKAEVVLSKFLEKVKVIVDKADAKAKADANKPAKTSTAKKEVTELSRSKRIFLMLGKGWTVKQILEANPEFAKSHTTNCGQSFKSAQTPAGNDLLIKAQEVATKLGIVIPEAPAVVEKPAEPTTAVSGEVVETAEEPKA